MRYLGGAVGHQQGTGAPAAANLAQDDAGEDTLVDIPREGSDDDGPQDSDEEEPDDGYVPSEDEPDEESTGVPNANSDSDSEPEIGPEDGENEEFVMGDAYDSIL